MDRIVNEHGIICPIPLDYWPALANYLTVDGDAQIYFWHQKPITFNNVTKSNKWIPSNLNNNTDDELNQTLLTGLYFGQFVYDNNNRPECVALAEKMKKEDISKYIWHRHSNAGILTKNNVRILPFDLSN